MSANTLSVKLLSPLGKLPLRASEGAAGFDLFSAVSATISPGETACVPTDIALSLPKGCYGRIASRSGLAVRNNVHVCAGVIDSDYRGNVCVVLLNLGKTSFQVNPGDRIAQLICEKVSTPQVVEVTTLESTPRADGGFGSTGIADIKRKRSNE